MFAIQVWKERSMGSFNFLLFCCLLFYVNGSNLNYTSNLPGTDICGAFMEHRIMGGEKTERNEFPWLALLEYRKGTTIEFKCGGSLINKRYVLTAAHCVRDKQLMKVRLGEHNVTTDPDCEPNAVPGMEECSDRVLRMNIEDKIVHAVADIALIRLGEEVAYTEWVQPICLPISEPLRNNSFIRTWMVVAGWGATANRSSSDVKLMVKVPVVSNIDCIRTGIYGKPIYESHLCAGGEEGKDSCKGDSGGPLMYHSNTTNEGNWYVVGVVSFGLDHCGLKYIPAVHVRVTSYIDWIIANLRP